MALPASGEISFNLFNTDRSIASGTTVDMAAAGTAYGVSYTTNGSNDLQMSEFYGKTAGGSPPVTPPPATPPPATPPPATPPPATPPPATPAPAVTATVTYDCNGTSASSGRIFITSIANGGTACYVGYSTQSGAPSTYATTYIGAGTSATLTGVADYGGSYRVYIYNSSNGAGTSYGLPSGAINCYTTPAPTPPPPTPPPVYYITLSSGTSACDAKNNWSNI